MAAPAKQITMSVGFQDPLGSPVANGFLVLALSQVCTVTAGGVTGTQEITLQLDANGKIPTTALWYQDELSPSGTVYYGRVLAANGARPIVGLDHLMYSFTGAGPIDLATAVQSSQANPFYSGAVLLTPTGNQTITSGNLTVNNNVAVGGTLGVAGVSALANVTLNGANTGTGAALTIGGTTATTGGISVFVGALGSQNERFAVVPADGSSAAARVGALSVRSLSGGFLTGTEVAKIDATGAISGLSLALGGGTALTTTNRTGTGNLVLASAPTVTSPTINTGVSQGSGFKHQRFGSLCTTAAAAGATCTTTLTWTSAFADANYTVVCTGHTQSNTAIGPTIEGVTATNFVVRIMAATGAASSFTSVDCIGIHD